MPYYVTYGQLQEELENTYRKTGKRIQFTEAVDALYKKGCLSETAPTSDAASQAQRNAGNAAFSGVVDALDERGCLSETALSGNAMSRTLKVEDNDAFSRLVDGSFFNVKPSAGLPERVNEDDIIPLLRDVLVIRHPRFTRPHPHRHDYVEIDCVVDGGCVFYFEDEKRELSAGAMCVIAPHSLHDIEITDDSTVYCIMLRRSTFETTFFGLLNRDDALSLFFRTMIQDNRRPNYLLFRTDNLPLMHSLIQCAMFECHTLDDYSNSCCISLINLLFSCVLRSYIDSPQFHNYQPIRDFSRILSYIRENYRTLTLTELADTFHYSKPHLCTLIKQNTGLNFTALIKKVRMNRAVEYLLGTELPISEAAELVGYHSTDHFSRVFRSVYGVSPQEYRRRNADPDDRFIPFEIK